ncbi:histidine phosphatase family protein [Geodermatophilus sp. SYSU D00697]
MTDAAPRLPVPRLVVWRHGRTEWNVTGRFQGQQDPPLDAEGRRQAAEAAAHLAATAALPEGTVVIASDLSRAAETAASLAGVLGVPLRLDPRLREFGIGSWEGLTREEVAERHPEQYADWLAGRPVRGRGGEDPADVPRRALAALRDLPEAPAAVVVTHGGTAARLLEVLLALGPEHRRVFGPLGNCAWSELAVQRDRWRLLRHNTSAPRVPSEPHPPVPAGAGPLVAGASPEEGAAAPAQDADAVL